MKDKILILGSFPAPYRVEVFKGILKEFECDIFFATDKDQNRNKDYFVGKDSFKYYVLNNSEDKTYYRRCLKNINEYKLVLAYDWYLGYALLAEILCIFNHIPYIINCDGAIMPREKNYIKTTIKDKIKYAIKRFFVKRSKLCFASGNNAKLYFLNYGADEKNIKIHNFTSLFKKDILKQKLTDEKKALLKNELLLGEKKVILSIGQFIYRKGFDLLINSWVYLDDKYKLIIIGGGEEKEKYLSIINSKHLKNVQLIDYLPHDIVKKYFMAADLFVLPTREDIWGLVVNEAMAFGVPVITTDKCVAGLELLHSKEINCVIKLENFESNFPKIADKILTDKVLYDKVINNNLELIAGYSLENIIKSHVINIRGVLNND